MTKGVSGYAMGARFLVRKACHQATDGLSYEHAENNRHFNGLIWIPVRTTGKITKKQSHNRSGKACNVLFPVQSKLQLKVHS